MSIYSQPHHHSASWIPQRQHQRILHQLKMQELNERSQIVRANDMDDDTNAETFQYGAILLHFLSSALCLRRRVRSEMQGGFRCLAAPYFSIWDIGVA